MSHPLTHLTQVKFPAAVGSFTPPPSSTLSLPFGLSSLCVLVCSGWNGNAWSPAGRAVWEGLGGVALLGEVCHWGQLQKAYGIPS